MLGEFKAGIGRLLLRSKVTGNLVVTFGVNVVDGGCRRRSSRTRVG